MSIVFSGLQALFGYFLIIGDLPCRRIFLEALGFTLYIHCSLAAALLSFTNNCFEPELYQTVLNMYRQAPFKTVDHFLVYPETFVFCGWLMFIYGLSSFLRYVGYWCRKNK